MFTGIIEGQGTIQSIRPGQGARMRVSADFDLASVKIGDSIAVSGACLTVVSLEGKFFDVDVAPETLERTTLGRARPGVRVNLEKALTFASRLDGHLVTGHIDGVGTVSSVIEDKNARLYTFKVSQNLARYLVEKGSVAVDGISLTINSCSETGFSVSIIPHTAGVTTMGGKKPGDPVNIETDIIGKYVERFVSAQTKNGNGKNSKINMDFLSKTGFL